MSSGPRFSFSNVSTKVRIARTMEDARGSVSLSRNCFCALLASATRCVSSIIVLLLLLPLLLTAGAVVTTSTAGACTAGGTSPSSGAEADAASDSCCVRAEILLIMGAVTEFTPVVAASLAFPVAVAVPIAAGTGVTLRNSISLRAVAASADVGPADAGPSIREAVGAEADVTELVCFGGDMTESQLFGVVPRT